MSSRNFINPDNKKQSIEIEECKLDKKLNDFESRSNRIPGVDEFYVDLGMQYRLAQVMNSKSKSFNFLSNLHSSISTECFLLSGFINFCEPIMRLRMLI